MPVMLNVTYTTRDVSSRRVFAGARRFVVLDFGKPVMLTDLVIPACNDLASLCIDSWVQSEEVDGQRLVVTTDIGYRSLVLNDLMPPPICRYLKVSGGRDRVDLV